MNFLESIFNNVIKLLNDQEYIDKKNLNNNDEFFNNFLELNINLKICNNNNIFSLDKFKKNFDINNIKTRSLLLGYLNLNKELNKNINDIHIKNLNSLIQFQKKNINLDLKFNIILKLYNKDDYIYVFINYKNVTKINKNKNLDNFFQIFEKENIFIKKLR